MDARPLWHPKGDPVVPEWPLVPPLQEDEILSSWLVRSALAHGCDPLTLTGTVWPGKRFWTRDPDMKLSSEEAEKLSRYSGIQRNLLDASTLHSICSQKIGRAHV